MAQDGYRTIRIREILLISVENVVKNHPELGYRSIADFVTDAVREKLQELRAHEGVAADAP